MYRRCRSIAAVWLVAQILLPFTAPFSTCDAANFFGTSSHAAPLAPRSSSHATLADAASGFVPMLATQNGRLRLAVTASDRMTLVPPALAALGEPQTSAVSTPPHRQLPQTLRL